MEAFELRLWDGRLGRWLTVDPMHQYASPYIGMGNNPIRYVDYDGGKLVPAPGTDMIKYNRYIAQLIAKFPDTYNLLENHPAIITVSFKDNIDNEPKLKGLTTVKYGLSPPSENDLGPNGYLMNDGLPIGVLGFEIYQKNYRGIITRGAYGALTDKPVRIVSYSEAQDFFLADTGMHGKITSISVEIRNDATFSTVGHEFGHAEFALRNPFLNFIWQTLIEPNFVNPSPEGAGHFPNNPSGKEAATMSNKVRSECSCDN